MPMLPDLCVRLAVCEDAGALEDLVAYMGIESTVVPVFWTHTFVAVQRGALIGFASWAQDEMLSVIVGLGVRPSPRRFGVASELLEATAEHLREDGVRLLECTVPKNATGMDALLNAHRFRAVGAWVQLPEAPRRWVVPYDPMKGQNDPSMCVRYERRLLGRRRNRGDGFYA